MALKFKNPEEMLNALKCMDLYNPYTETYAFIYNDSASIAVYSNIELDQAVELEKDARKDKNYWGAYMGPGGLIYDDPTHPDYIEDSLTNLDWCKVHFEEEGWIPTTEVLEYKKNVQKYYVTFKVDGRLVVEVDATSVDAARRLAAEKSSNISVGDIEVVDEKDIAVENSNGDIVWDIVWER